MADTMIGPEMCPACGRVVWLVRLMHGLRYDHGSYADQFCVGREYVHPDEAEAVRRIRAHGGERLRLAAHP